MTEVSAVADGVMLDGEWYLDRANELLTLLASKLALLLEAEPAPDNTEIDLSGIVDLDACGCQLLAVFLENLKRHGITAVPCRIPQQVADKIRLFGLSDTFDAPRQPESQSA